MFSNKTFNFNVFTLDFTRLVTCFSRLWFLNVTNHKMYSICYHLQMSIFSAISWQEHVTFDDTMMNPVLYYTLGWIFIELTDWDNSPHWGRRGMLRRNVSPLGYIIQIPSQPVFALSREVANTNLWSWICADRESNSLSTA